MVDASKLRDYQVPHVTQLLRSLIAHKAVLDASDTGTGKTYCALSIAKALGLSPFVICPKSLIPTWETVGAHIGVRVHAVNYERARMVKNDPVNHCGVGVYGSEIPHGKGSYWRWHQDIAFGIFDEVQMCAGMSTLNSKLLKAAKRQFGYLLMLSATAAEAIQHMNALGFALGLHTGRDFYDWLLRRGCKPNIWGGMPVMPPEKARAILATLHEDIFPRRGARMRKRDIPSFPPTQIDLLPLVASEQEMALAQDAAEAAPNDLEKWQHSMQELERRAVPQIVELAEVYAETSSVAVFVNYRATVDALLKALPVDCGLVDGRQVGANGARERQQNIEAFQKNRLRFLVLNTQAGGIGVSLHDPSGQRERTALILPNFSGRTLAQVLGRVHRDGGAASQQFLLAYKGTFQEQATRVALTKLDSISMFNDRELFGFSHL